MAEFCFTAEVFSRVAPGGAVKQLAFDSTTAAKTNMADERAKAGSSTCWFRDAMQH